MQPDQRSGRSSLPDQRTLLSWLFIGRLTLAVGSLVGAGLVVDRAAPGILPGDRHGGRRADVHRLRFLHRALARRSGGEDVPPDPGAGGPERRHDGGPLRGAAAVGLPGALRPGGRRLRPAHAPGHAARSPPSWPPRSSWATRCGPEPTRPTRPSGPRCWSSTWSSPSWRCWATGSARPGWSRRPSPPSCSGSGSRPTTSSGTSAPACSPWTGSAGWPSSIRRRSGCSTSRARR